MTLLPKSEPARLAYLVALAQRRRRVRRARWIALACAVGAGVVGLVYILGVR